MNNETFIKDFADKTGYIDIDVGDTTYDMLVGFVHDFKASKEDSYDEFMDYLGKNIPAELNGDMLLCDFSSVFGEDWGDDEDMIISLERLIAGCYSENDYKDLLIQLKSREDNKNLNL